MASKRREKSNLPIVLFLILGIAAISAAVYFSMKDQINTFFSNLFSTSKVENFIDEKIIGSEGELGEVKSSANLKDMMDITELRTLNYRFNSICEKVVDGKPVCYLAYKGRITLGIDMKSDEVETTVDESSKTITVVLPNVKILDEEVDSESIEYIFFDNSYNTPDLGKNALSDCKNDLHGKVIKEALMFKMADDNTKKNVEAILEPIIDQCFNKAYRLNVLFAKEMGGQENA